MAKPKEKTQDLPDQVKSLISQGIEACVLPDGNYDMGKYLGALRASLGDDAFGKFEGSIIRQMQPEGFFGYAKATWSGEGVMPKVVTVAQLTGAFTLITIGLEGAGAALDIDQIRVLSWAARKLLGD